MKGGDIIDLKKFRERIKVLEKLISNGYNTDKKITDLNLEKIITLEDFSRQDLIVALSIKNALSNKEIVAFLCDNQSQK